ncbi:MCE family protein [Mycobacterium sp. 1274761.0]|uniref:MCE family protein n=1 Tax=Mycobacterium sp. 1274761.0 TaxID=1834077 RepID=UPI0007FCA085|nr:MCE family protein [Mycobacterium sp. 1274761.0]OBK70771.1 mammalian cell entry protein [Mycobacterium sp. 1274761.0]
MRGALLIALALILIAGSAVVVRQEWFHPQTITAYFSSATGLYPGDEVRVAGVKVGTIAAVTPQPDHAAVTLQVDHGVAVPADARAVIVAQNLVAARYVQLAPLYRPGQPRLGDGDVIAADRTAVPIEWDEVKTQLSRLATELGPDSTLSTSSAGRFINSAANAMAGNGDKLRQTFAQLSQLARILSEGSGDVVATIKNLQTFVTALRDSSDDLVLFSDRLATFSAVLDDSRSDLDAAMTELAIAVGEVQRFVANTRDKTSEQVQRLANSTQVLVDHRTDLENILHVAPTAFANAYNILNPNVPGGLGTFVFANFANPVAFICSAIGAIENVTASETGKLCAQYLGPALRLLNFNILPQPPLNPFLMPSVTPDKLSYTDPSLAEAGPAGPPDAPEPPPAVSAYTGAGDVPPPPGFGAPPAGAASSTPGPTLPDLLLPAEAPPS